MQIFSAGEALAGIVSTTRLKLLPGLDIDQILAWLKLLPNSFRHDAKMSLEAGLLFAAKMVLLLLRLVKFTEKFKQLGCSNAVESAEYAGLH